MYFPFYFEIIDVEATEIDKESIGIFRNIS